MDTYLTLGIAEDSSSENESACNNPKSMTKSGPAMLDASKLVKKLVPESELKPLPDLDRFEPMKEVTDHMLVATYDPIHGWFAPEIRPYGVLSLDPASACLHYALSVFEGMKAVLGLDGRLRLFRPLANAERLLRSARRLGLPSFDPSELVKLIKQFVLTESRWVFSNPGHCVYIRPTIIGTSTLLAPQASDCATLLIFIRPTVSCLTSKGSLNMSPEPIFTTPISLLAVKDSVRAWPGGTGSYKISGNYASTFVAKRLAKERGFDQVLWLMPAEKDNSKMLEDTVTEAGDTNFFVVFKREKKTGCEEDGVEELDIITPTLKDGLILPGIVRDSCLNLLAAHDETLPSLPRSKFRLHVHERRLALSELFIHSMNGTLVEAFCTGTAVGVAPVGKIELDDLSLDNGGEKTLGTIIIPTPGIVRNALFKRLEEIRRGQFNRESWSVPCEE